MGGVGCYTNLLLCCYIEFSLAAKEVIRAITASDLVILLEIVLMSQSATTVAFLGTPIHSYSACLSYSIVAFLYHLLTWFCEGLGTFHDNTPQSLRWICTHFS